MKRPLYIVGILIGIIALMGIASASISVGNIQITPSGDLVAGKTQASASFNILFSSSGGYTFDNSHVLSMDTELADPIWTYSLFTDGNENPSKTFTGPNIRLSGWELSYPSDRDISVKARLEGTAPSVNTSKEQIVLRVRELDNRNTVVSGTEVVKKKMVINPSSVGQTSSSASVQLAAIKTQLDALSASGVNTADAQAKYTQAASLVQSASKSSDYVKATNDLISAQKLIDALGPALLSMQAQKSLNDAETPIGETETLITYFKVNKSMGSDARLMPIITNWEIASDRLTTAKDLYREGKYNESMLKAGEAADKGNEVLGDAQALKKTVDANPFSSVTGIFSGVGGVFSGLASIAMTIVIVIAVVIVVIVAIVLFRRRRRWDELG